jgi:hypothetical protein
MAKIDKVKVKGIEINFIKINSSDYISLTDIAKFRDKDRSNYIIQNWMRNRSTIEFLGLWEKINNLNFKGIEFDAFKNASGSNSFSLTPKLWIEKTNSIGIIAKSGRYRGGTFAHKDIAFEFATWISPEFKMYLIKEFQRLKDLENQNQISGWSVSRILSKLNYKIHTDAIKRHIIPPMLSEGSMNIIYANEADVLNVALFGMTAKDWRFHNEEKEGNVRDYASIEQLVVLSNLESLNAEFIKSGLSQKDRLIKLNKVAIDQIELLIGNKTLNKLQQLI